MADDEATPDRAQEKSAKRGTQSNPERQPEEVRYSVEDLKENARGLLDVSPHAVAGAFSDTDQKTFTLDAAAKRVNDFLKRPVERADA